MHKPPGSIYSIQALVRSTQQGEEFLISFHIPSLLFGILGATTTMSGAT
jgi:hypothetical protein